MIRHLLAFPFIFLSGQKENKCWHELNLETDFEQVPSNIYNRPINREGVVMTGSEPAAHSVGYNLANNNCHRGNRSMWGWTPPPPRTSWFYLNSLEMLISSYRRAWKGHFVISLGRVCRLCWVEMRPKAGLSEDTHLFHLAYNTM